MQVPLGISAYNRTDGLVPEVQMYNFYLEKDESGLSIDGMLRIQRPGLSLLDQSLPSRFRGLSVAQETGVSLSVAGETFYRDLVAQEGIVGGSEWVEITSTKFATALCDGFAAYLWTEADGLAQIEMPDGRAVVDVDQIDSYILLLCPDGVFYWLEPGETEVDPLNFAEAESSADGGVFIRRIGDEFWIGGTKSVEPWQPTGDQDAPFERASGRIMARGSQSAAAARRFDNTIVWIGDDNNVYRGGAVPTVISTPAIAERIRKRSADMSAWTFGMDAHSFLALRIPSQGSFLYDASTQQWSKWGSEGESDWLAHVGYEWNGDVLAGSSADGSFWRLTNDAYGDSGAPFERILTGTVPIIGKPPRNDSLTVGVGASSDCTMRLRWRDGQDGYPVDYYEELEVRAPYDLPSLYRLGQPQPPYREVEVSFVDNVRVRVAGCLANEGWQ